MKFGHVSDRSWVPEEALRELLWEHGYHADFIEHFVAAATIVAPGTNQRGILIDDMLEGVFAIFFNAWCMDTSRKDGPKCYPQGFAPRQS